MAVSERTGHISICWVDPHHQRKGVGRALLAKLEGWFQARGIIHLEVSFMVKNETARDAWSQLGFMPFRTFAYKEISEQTKCTSI